MGTMLQYPFFHESIVIITFGVGSILSLMLFAGLSLSEVGCIEGRQDSSGEGG